MPEIKQPTSRAFVDKLTDKIQRLLTEEYKSEYGTWPIVDIDEHDTAKGQIRGLVVVDRVVEDDKLYEAHSIGIIITQLLQAQCKRELNPQGAAGRIMQSAREGIEGFASATHADPRLKQRALEAVQQYEDQIRSVLAV